MSEPTLEPELPIIDSHHHLFDKATGLLGRAMGYERFLIDEYTEFVDDGHNVVGSVIVESPGMDSIVGPEDERWVGATQFLAGQAAMASTGRYRGIRVAAGIVSTADLRGGERVPEILEAHMAAGSHYFKGIRQEAMWDPDPSVLMGIFTSPPQLYLDPSFRKGLTHLGKLGLTFDAFVLAHQLADITDLAHSFPDQRIILNHLGNPVGIGAHAGKMEEEYPAWLANVTDIARCDNVVVKMGGLGTFLSGSPYFRSDPPATSAQLADEWRPYAEKAVELFGANRVMFESNMPTDGSGSFNVVANAYKTICSGCSDSELESIFAGTAREVYTLDVGTERLVRPADHY
jgi:L-fuconolactonase